MRKNQKMYLYLLISVFLTSAFLAAIFENNSMPTNTKSLINLQTSPGTVNETSPEKKWTHDFDEYINSIVFSDDGNYVVAGIGNDVYLGNISSMDEKFENSIVKQWTTNYEVKSVAISGNNSIVVAGSADDKLYVFNASSETPLWSKNLNNDDVLAVDISYDGKYIVAGSSNCLYLFDVNSTELWHYNGTGNGVNNDIRLLEMSKDGYYIAAGAVYDVLVFNRTSSIPMWNHDNNWNGNFYSLAISADGNYTVAGNWDNNIYLFNNTDITNPLLWSSPTYDGVFSVDISSNGSYIVAGGDDKYIYLFNQSSPIADWKYNTYSKIYKVAISSDGNYFTAATSNNLYLFNRTCMDPLWTVPLGGQTSALAISHNGSFVAAGTLDGDFYLIGFNYVPSSYNGGGPEPITIIIIIVIVGSVISVSAVSSYTIVSKQKEKKEIQRKALSKLKHKPKTIGAIVSGKDAIDNKKDGAEKKPNDFALLTPIPKGTTEGHVKKKKAPKQLTRETSKDRLKAKKEIEKTRSEMDIKENVDLCLVHKGRIEGINYTCPKCQAKYCLKCATHLANNDKNCWVCNEPISLGTGDKNKNNISENLQEKNPLELFNDENGLEKLKNLENINITAVSSELLKEINKFNWNEEDRKEFIKEMGSLDPKLRKEFLEEMKKNSELRDINE